MSRMSGAIVVTAVAVAVGVGLSCDRASGWADLDSARSTIVHVGANTAPPNNMCCVMGEYIPCTPPCITNPNCVQGSTINDSCSAPACQPVNDPNSTCSKPTRQVVWQQAKTCVLTGTVLGCNNGAGQDCETKSKNFVLTYTACNAAQSLCSDDDQPDNPCD
jgi:hypothetical protein